MLIEPSKPTQAVTAPKTPPSEPGHLITDLIRSKMQKNGISQAPKSTATIIPLTTTKLDPDRTVITAEEFLAPLYDKPETPPPAPEPTEVKAPEKKIRGISFVVCVTVTI